jgi:hypothetical protein
MTSICNYKTATETSAKLPLVSFDGEPRFNAFHPRMPLGMIIAAAIDSHVAVMQTLDNLSELYAN